MRSAFAAHPLAAHARFTQATHHPFALTVLPAKMLHGATLSVGFPAYSLQFEHCCPGTKAGYFLMSTFLASALYPSATAVGSVSASGVAALALAVASARAAAGIEARKMRRVFMVNLQSFEQDLSRIVRVCFKYTAVNGI
jgi:hypothetical protein